MKKIFLFLLTFFIFGCSEAFSFSIEPARLELFIPAGRQKGKTILVDNTKGDTPLHIKIYAQDLNYLPDGTIEFLPIGSTAWSCGGWIKTVPGELDVPAGKSKSVRVSVEVPAGTKGGRYATLFFESGIPSPIKGIGANLRIGVTVLVTVSGTENYQAKLNNISFVRPVDVEVSVFNEGNVFIRPYGKVKILNERGRRIKTLELNPNNLGILPTTLRKFNIKLDESLAKGKYKIKAEVDVGREYLLVGETPIEIE